MATLQEFANTRQGRAVSGLQTFTQTRSPTAWKPMSVVKPKKITPIKKITQPKKITPISKPIREPLTSFQKGVRDVIKKVAGFTLQIVNPALKDVVSPKPQEVVTKKPIELKPKQTKLTKEQMGIIGPTEQQFKPAPKKTIWQKIVNKYEEIFDLTSTKKARAMNAVAVQKLIKQKTGKTLSLPELEKKGGSIVRNSLMEDVTKELGIRQTPTTKEFGETIMTIAIVTGLTTATIPTITAIGLFGAVSELTSGLISAVKGKGFKLGTGQTFSDLFEEAPADVKNILDIVDFLAKAKITHKFYKAQPKIFERLTKDIIIETKAPRTFNLTPEQVKKINLGLSDKYEADLVKSLDLTGNQWKQGVLKGLRIEVATEKLTRIVDKSYWKKVKSIIGAKPTAIETKDIIGAKAKEGFAGYLTDGEKTPNEVINAVMQSGQEKTVEGKELIKTAMEAKKQGKNIEITKEVVKPVEKELEPLAKEAKKFKSAEEFATKSDYVFQGVGKGKQSDFLTTNIKEADVYATQRGLKGTGEIRIYDWNKLPDSIKTITKESENYDIVLKELGSNFVNKPLTKQQFAKVQTSIGFSKEEISKLPLVAKIKNQQQLTDIYKQATAVKPPVEIPKPVEGGVKSLVNQPPSRFKTGEELVNYIDVKGSGSVGVKLNQAELNQLKDHVMSLNTPENAKWQGTIYKSYSGNKDIILGVVQDPASKGFVPNAYSNMYIVATDSGYGYGKVRTHATPIEQKNILGKIDINKNLHQLTEGVGKVGEIPKGVKGIKIGEPKGVKPVVKPKEKIVKVPREQLPVGEGEEKVSRLEARVKKTLDNVSQEQIDKLGLSTFNKMTHPDQRRKASEYVIKNPDDAMKVLMGEIEAPKGILRNSIYVAMTESDIAIKNKDLATKLATLSSTRYGQEIEYLKELNPTSPVNILKGVIKIQEETFKRKFGGKTIKEVGDKQVKKGKADLKKQLTKNSKMNWASIIKEVRC